MQTKKGQKGFSLIELLIVVAIIGIIAAIAIPNLISTKRAANEGSAVSTLRTLHSAESTYKSTAGNGDYGTLAQLTAQNLIDAQLATGVKSGFNFAVNPAAAGTDPATFEATAVPSSTAAIIATGTRRFGLTEAGIMYTDTASLGTAFTRAEMAGTGSGTLKVMGN